jgi:osmotically-inducible protein OsmY
MKKMSAPLLAAGIGLLLDAGLCAAAPPAGSPDLQPQDANVSTARSNQSDDVAVTAQIRSALLKDQTLSAEAKRIQIVTNSDAVILRGMVQTQEPDRIETEVRQYVGSRQILNQLTVIDSH